MSDQELMCLASGGRLLVARPYNKRMSHQQCLEASLAAAEVKGPAGHKGLGAAQHRV